MPAQIVALIGQGWHALLLAHGLGLRHQLLCTSDLAQGKGSVSCDELGQERVSLVAEPKYDGLSVELVYDNLDFMRGVEVFLNGIPATSIEGMHQGMVDMGAAQSNQVVIMDKLMDSDPLFLTGNTDTVYASAILNLESDGPTVVEIPAGTQAA